MKSYVLVTIWFFALFTFLSIMCGVSIFIGFLFAYLASWITIRLTKIIMLGIEEAEKEDNNEE